ncbi:hypothetical protein MMC24_003257 [Lignoscripta atroalba]|nr:hypothetical protein [Lignoscripta atroalba]
MSRLTNASMCQIKSLGGLQAIVISHPHFYTTYVEWAQAFGCPVYTSIEDLEWLDRQDVASVERRLIKGPTETIVEGVTAVKTGGHFDGSLVLHWEDKLFIADSLMTVPVCLTTSLLPHILLLTVRCNPQSAIYHNNRPPGTTSYAFMWSIPNMIPLPPDVISKIWQSLKPFSFTSTHGSFPGQNVRDFIVKKRVLESAKIQIRAEGYQTHELLNEEYP